VWTLLLHEVSNLSRNDVGFVHMLTVLRCAIDRFIKSPKCYACGAATSGIFNKAEKILGKMEAKNKRRREEKGIYDEAGDGGIEIGGGSDDEVEEEGDEAGAPEEEEEEDDE
jgi:RING finger protein 113A